MKRVAICVPEELYSKKDLDNPCPCQLRPVKMKNKAGVINWKRAIGETVMEGEVVGEGEVEKKTLEFLAPCNGTLVEICVLEEEKFTFGDVLAYIEAEGGTI